MDVAIQLAHFDFIVKIGNRVIDFDVPSDRQVLRGDTRLTRSGTSGSVAMFDGL